MVDFDEIFEINDEKIDVEEIMDNIRKNIKQHVVEEELPDLNTLPGVENEILNNTGWYVDPEQPITSHRRFTGKFIVFGKKVVRKFLRWYINPPFNQQREFNRDIANEISHLAARIEKMEEKILHIENSLKKSDGLNSDN